MQKFNEHYETITTFKAHDGLILASAYTKCDDKSIFVTGGNDNTVVIWEVKDCADPDAVARRSNNGKSTEEEVKHFTNTSRSNGGVTHSICFVPNGIITAQVPRGLPTRRIILTIRLPELWCCHGDDQH